MKKHIFLIVAGVAFAAVLVSEAGAFNQTSAAMVKAGWTSNKSTIVDQPTKQVADLVESKDKQKQGFASVISQVYSYWYVTK